MTNLNIPVKYISILHLGGGQLSLVTLITDLSTPLRGANVSRNLELSVFLPYEECERYIQDLLLIHAHGEAMPVIIETVDKLPEGVGDK